MRTMRGVCGRVWKEKGEGRSDCNYNPPKLKKIKFKELVFNK